jgi:hypothetical protein
MSVKERIEALIKEYALPDAVVVCDLVDYNDLWEALERHQRKIDDGSILLLCAHDDGRYSTTPVVQDDCCPRGHLYMAKPEELARLKRDWHACVSADVHSPVAEPVFESYMTYSAQGWNV